MQESDSVSLSPATHRWRLPLPQERRRDSEASLTLLRFGDDDFLGREVWYCPTHRLVFQDQNVSLKHTGTEHCIAYQVDIVKHWDHPGGELVLEVRQDSGVP